jgi:hypothetical protein
MAKTKFWQELNGQREILVKKPPYNSLSKWLSKYSHFPFRIFRYSNIEGENSSLESVHKI